MIDNCTWIIYIYLSYIYCGKVIVPVANSHFICKKADARFIAISLEKFAKLHIVRNISIRYSIPNSKHIRLPGSVAIAGGNAYREGKSTLGPLTSSSLRTRDRSRPHNCVSGVATSPDYWLSDHAATYIGTDSGQRARRAIYTKKLPTYFHPFTTNTEIIGCK